MTLTQSMITIAIVIIGTMLTRFLPFMLFPADKTPPHFISFLGKVLPHAVIGFLVIFSLKDSIHAPFFCLPELIAILWIFLLHKWKKSMLLSIAGGTLLYMFLVQYCFL